VIDLVVASAAKTTGRYLRTALSTLNVGVGASTKRVSYGVPLHVPHGSSALNANAGRLDKFEQMKKLNSAGITVPLFWLPGQTPSKFPLLARKRHHKGGTDIMPVFMAEEMSWRVLAGAEFFVEYIPWQAEYRTWIFRSAHLGTDRKVLTNPSQYKKIGCNAKNGFTFQTVHQDDVPRAAVEAAMRSIHTLDLDFGAVDILLGKDSRYYVLEVNTAPGVESAERRLLRSLAQKIANWNANPVERRKTYTPTI